MKITEEQLSLIDTLSCERLSSHAENLRLIDSFHSSRNNNVAEALLNEAYREDEEGVVAYYIIKDKQNQVLFFFSLKCGLLFDEFIEGEKLTRLKELCSGLSEKLNKGLIASEDINSLFDPNVKNVGKTFPGIEIVHFCANDDCRETWDNLGLDQSLGTIVFWHFIVPKIFELQKIVGCEYLFLFAADCDPDEHLVNYYNQKLKFTKADEHSAAMPIYDFTCKFMYQRIADLSKGQNSFYDNFNYDIDAV